MYQILCPNCGNIIVDPANFCTECGYPLNLSNTGGGYPTSVNGMQPVQYVQPIPRCPKCCGTDIEYTIETVEQRTKGRAEVRKKSPVTRAGNAIGRGVMIGMTGGLWALTPKKSQYSEKQKGKTKIKHKTYAICTNCGHSWKV